MTLKRIISILLACVLICAMFTTNVFAATNGTYTHVVKEHDTQTNTLYDFYSFSGYCSTDAFIYSFVNTLTDTPATVQARSGLIVYYEDGTSDIAQNTSDELLVAGANKGVVAYAEVFYDEEKEVTSFFFRHNYYVDGVAVGNKSYTCDYGVNNF